MLLKFWSSNGYEQEAINYFIKDVQHDRDGYIANK